MDFHKKSRILIPKVYYQNFLQTNKLNSRLPTRIEVMKQLIGLKRTLTNSKQIMINLDDLIQIYYTLRGQLNSSKIIQIEEIDTTPSEILKEIHISEQILEGVEICEQQIPHGVYADLNRDNRKTFNKKKFSKTLKTF